MNMCIIWIIALIVFVIIEALTYQILTIWFAIGSLGGIVCALLDVPVAAQICVVVGVSALALLILRPATLKRLKKEPEKTNVDSLIGADVLITETASSMSGKGKLCGMEWTVRVENGGEIPEGETATVKRIEGVKLFVERKEK